MKIYTIPVGELQTNCYIVASEAGNAAIIDPGAQAEELIKAMGIFGVQPGYILLTHAHYDHIGAVKALQEAYPGLRLLLGEDDLDMLSDPMLNLGGRFADPGDFTGLKADTLLHDGDSVQLDDLTFTVITTPGHTKGGVTYQVENVLFSGDTLFHREVGRCDLYGGSFPALERSIAKLYALPGEDYTVYPGHGPSTTIREERAENPYVRG